MDYLRSLGTTLALGVKGGIPGFGYSLGERVSEYDGKSIWTLYQGVRKEDGLVCSIFGFDVNSSGSGGFGRNYQTKDRLPLARNALKKLRSTRHPDVIRFLDGVESDTHVYIATEQVRPIRAWLGDIATEQEARTAFVGWALVKVATAVAFLNQNCDAIHGNLRLDSLFCIPSGQCKLAGFELMTGLKDDQPVIFNYGGLVPEAGRYSCPEVRSGGWQVLRQTPSSTNDSYQFGLLAYEAYNPTLHLPADSSAPPPRGTIPPDAFALIRKLLAPNTKARLSTSEFCQLALRTAEPGQAAGFLQRNELRKVADGLEALAVGQLDDSESLLRILKDSPKKFPPAFVQYKVVPELVKAFEFGSNGPSVLPLLLTLSSSLTDDDFATIVLPAVIRMFASPDRAMRLTLLDHLASFVDRFTEKQVSNQIWPNIATGFGDTVPIIREATVKSILLLAPKISSRLLNNELLRYLAKSQMDVEPGIRTNSIICLGRLSTQLGESTRKKVLIPAFARSLRDPFLHARVAALMAFTATADLHSIDDGALKIIPTLSSALIDKEKVVRTHAFAAMELYLNKVKAHAASMPLTEEAAPSQNGTTAAVTAMPSGMNAAAGTASAWAGWAVTSLSKKLAAADLQSEITAEAGVSASLRPDAFEHERSTGKNGVPRLSMETTSRSTTTQSSPKLEPDIWTNGDLMDVTADELDDPWAGSYLAAQPKEIKTVVPAVPRSSKLVSTKSKAKVPLATPSTTGAPLKLGGGEASRRALAADVILQDLAPKDHEESAEDAWAEEDNLGFGTTVVDATAQTAQPALPPVEANDWADDSFDTDVGKYPAAQTIVAPKIVLSKEERAADLARKKEERRERMAQLKAQKGKS